MRYAVVIEKAEGNYSAYVPDLAGCVVTGNTVEEVESEIREGIDPRVEMPRWRCIGALPLSPERQQV
jgi:predicted RNase H-like HicB family nuclease